ncbi:hypothetical protein ACFV29_04425 [Streptomyces sp. NPDC059690]|uniref:hypothetical protein n=1 Tax=Streptomyces sp. NPDC059690 TaxID=3346907 RepID=UPI00367F829A
MSDLDVKLFGAHLKGHPRDKSWSAALVVGFDGGAALLGHDGPEVFQDDLLVPQYRRVEVAWRSILHDLKYRNDWMEKHTTSSSPNKKPDMRAMWCIARMVRDGYLRTIIATDNARVFYDTLTDLGVMMARYQCSASVPNHLSAKAAGCDSLFIDGGELLLRECEPDILGNEAEHTGRVHQALQSYLAGFNAVYCWGWCNVNYSIKDILPVSSERLKILGWYESTLHGVTLRSSEYSLVECGGSRLSKTADTEIFHRLADELFDDEEPPDLTARQQAAPESTRPAPPNAIPWTLLSEEWRAQLVTNVEQHRVSYVGVDGEVTRGYCFDWLAADLRGRGHNVVERTDSDISALGKKATLMSGLDQDIWFIGRLNGDATIDQEWQSTLLSYSQHWNGRSDVPHHERTEAGSRIVLLLPAMATSGLESSLPKDDGTWVTSVFAHSHLDQDTVINYVESTAGPPIADITAADISRLAKRMIDRCRAGDAPPLDWLHDALDLWRRLLQSAITDRASEATSSGHESLLTYDDLLRLWEEVVTLMTKAEVPLDFDLGPVHLRIEGKPYEDDHAREDDDSPDFDLGPATPRR